eukprot:15359400-Ditylum_brightwellii.AAC.1
MDQTHKLSEDKNRAMMKHLDYMLNNNAELECPVFPAAYVDTVGVANIKQLSCAEKSANDDNSWSMFGMCVWGNTSTGALCVSEGSTVNTTNIKRQMS